MSCSDATEFTFDPIEIDPAESRKVELDLFGKCANFWRANEQYGAGEHIRSTRPLGVSHECTTPGTSGGREPLWNTTIGAALATLDGSAGWTCRAAGANGLNPISAPSALSDPTGLNITAVSVSENCKILATYTAPGSVHGKNFDAVFAFTLNGVPRVVRQTVKIRKQ